MPNISTINERRQAMAERDEFGAFLIGFIIGGLTGAAVSLLMAPQTGEETRVYLKDRAIELREKAQETANATADQVGSTAAEVRNRAEDLASRARSNAEELRQRSQVILEEQKSKLQNLRGGSDQETAI
jgi:gas vesicle protein